MPLLPFAFVTLAHRRCRINVAGRYFVSLNARSRNLSRADQSAEIHYHESFLRAPTRGRGKFFRRKTRAKNRSSTKQRHARRPTESSTGPTLRGRSRIRRVDRDFSSRTRGRFQRQGGRWRSRTTPIETRIFEIELTIEVRIEFSCMLKIYLKFELDFMIKVDLK